MKKYICKINLCNAKDRPENRCVFNYNTKDYIKFYRNCWCIYRASYVTKNLEEVEQ